MLHNLGVALANISIRLLLALAVATIPGCAWGFVLQNIMPPALTFTLIFVAAGIALEYTYDRRVF